MKCGRGPDSSNDDNLKICPAAVDKSYDGLNGGKNGGRFCWAVAGTFCGGKVQGTFAEKRKHCLECSFFQLILSEDENSSSSSKDAKDTKFLNYIEKNAKDSFLCQLTCKLVRAGERFVTQGQPGEHAFIIQGGTCLTIVEKDDKLYPICHRGKGEIVGIRSFLTGEPRNAHIEAETDLKLWVLNKKQFENLSKQDPELITFLTEIVASQFDSKRPIADRKIGKYTARNIIGRGSYSIVYKGIHSTLKFPVAIKMIRHNLMVGSDFYDYFKNEAHIIARMDHDNIVRIYDVEERFKTIFLIMEYLEGESLQGLLGRLKTIPPLLAVSYLQQICSGLGYAHRKGIIHRDINTVNVFVKNNDCVKILDFGLACPSGTDDCIMGGTLQYQSPELFDGEPADERSDIYAMGITAYEMITGMRPYPEGDGQNLILARYDNEIPDPVKKVPDIPRHLRSFIRTACRCNPDQRYQNMEEALAELQPLRNKVKYFRSKDMLSRRQTTTLVIQNTEEQQHQLAKLLEEFNERLEMINIDMSMHYHED